MAGGWSFPGTAHFTTPVFGFYTPMSDAGQNIASHQGTMCEQFELNFYRCCEAFGMVASRRKCDLEYRDFVECVFQAKQMNRLRAMRKERMKQFLEGKLDRPWMKNPAKLFEARPDYYAHENIMPNRPFN